MRPSTGTGNGTESDTIAAHEEARGGDRGDTSRRDRDRMRPSRCAHRPGDDPGDDHPVDRADDDDDRAAGRVPLGRLPSRVTVRERGPGRWQVVVYAGVDPVTGRERRIRRTVRGGKRDALALERRLKTDLAEGRLGGTDITLADAIAAWLERAAADLSPTTVHKYRQYVDVHIIPALGAVKLSRVTPHRLEVFYDALRDERGLAPASIRQAHAIIRRALANAVRLGWIPANPAAAARPPKIPKIRRRTISATDARRIVDAAQDDPEFGILIALAAATGARRGDLCGLRWREVDLDAGVVRFVETLVQYGPDLAVKGTKNDAPRVVTVDAETVDRLRAHRRAAIERALAVGVALQADAYVATSSPDGMTPIRPDTVTQRYGRLVRRLGLDGWRLHDLRHWHASVLLDAGVPLPTVSERLGHRDQSTTANIYAHALPATDHRAAEVIGDLLRHAK